MEPEPWRPLFALSVDAYYDRKREAGEAACEQLLSRTDLPDDIRLLTRQNQTYYARQLLEAAPSTHFRRLDAPVTPGWSSFNPSIAAASDGFRVIVRSANYWFGYGVPPEIGPVGHSVSYLIDLDHDLEVRSTAAIRDETDPAARFPSPVQDFEDCRLFKLGEDWYALGTAQDRNPDRVYRMCLLRIEDDVFRDVHVLEDAGGSVHEKNWAPLVADGTLYLVYSAFPTRILRVDARSGTLRDHASHEAPPVARHWRGGSQAIPFDDGFLMLVHEAIPFDGPWRTYRHRWVLLDREFRVQQCSRQFAFLYRGVEFAAGLARRGDDLIASFGLYDRESYLAVMPSDEVRAMLVPAWEIGDHSARRDARDRVV